MTQWSKPKEETKLNIDPVIIEAVVKQILKQKNQKLKTVRSINSQFVI